MNEREVIRWMSERTLGDIPALLSDRRRTYRHPYGFLVSKLQSEDILPWTARVHHWPGAARTYESLMHNDMYRQLIHAHGWNLLSLVLAGALEERSYEVETTAEGRYLRYTTPGNVSSASSVLRRSAGNWSAELKSCRLRGIVSGVYRIDMGEYHSTLSAAPSISLVATHQFPGQQSSVLVGGSDARILSNPSPNIDTWPTLEAPSVSDDWAASFVYLRSESDVLLVRTTSRPDQWQPVGGRRNDDDKSPIATAIREVREETGVNLDPTSMTWVGVWPADLGRGMVFFWAATLDLRQPDRLVDPELAEGRWWPLAESVSLPMYGGSRQALTRLENDLRL